MQKTNKIFIILVFLIGILINPCIVEASSGTINITSSSNTVVVGNTVTVNITLSSSSPLGAWEFDVNYDSSFLKLTSSNAENNGTYFVNSGNGTAKSKSYTLKFRALKSGSTNITVGSYDIYAFDTSKMSINKSNKKITIMTQQELEATYSKDNNLKSLSVEGFELDKPFDKDTLDYTVNVPTGTTAVKVVATENDKTASVSGTGDIEVTEGLNTVPIVVTAQNGDQKTYNLTINVEDQNPINVTVDKNDYSVVKNAALLEAPATFTESKITINDFEIPAFVNESASITLVGLKNTSGDTSLFIYDKGKYTPFNEMHLKNYLLIPVPFEKELDLIKTTVKINNQKMEVYKYNEETEFVIISAKNLEDGKVSLYLYDTKNDTAIRYDDTFVNSANETIKNYTFIIISFAGALIIMLIIIFCLLHSVKKKQNKINKFVQKHEAKLEATRKLSDVVKEVKKISEAEPTEEKETEVEIEESPEPLKEIEPEPEPEPIIPKKEKERLPEEMEEGNLSLTQMLTTITEEDITPNLSKKELKKLKKAEKKAQKQKEKHKEEIVEIKEIQSSEEDPNNTIKKVLEGNEEVYDLFEDDKKRKKKL